MRIYFARSLRDADSVEVARSLRRLSGKAGKVPREEKVLVTGGLD